MSFNLEAKKALCSTYPKKNCCKAALLYGYLYGCRGFSDNRIKIEFPCSDIGDYICTLFSDVFSIALAPEPGIVIDDSNTLLMIFHRLGTDSGARLSDIIFTCENCSQSFLKGLFLSCAHMSDPAKGYCLEFSGLDSLRAHEIADFCALQGLPPGTSLRRSKPVLYYKSARVIEQFLSYIGAGKALFGVLNAKMVGEERNAINRRTNFESANLGRTVSAASEQVSAAKQLKRAGKLHLLPEQLQTSAALRIEHPDVSLSELAALHDPAITKSCLTHRLKKIVQLAQEEK